MGARRAGRDTRNRRTPADLSKIYTRRGRRLVSSLPRASGGEPPSLGKEAHGARHGLSRQPPWKGRERVGSGRSDAQMVARRRAKPPQSVMTLTRQAVGDVALGGRRAGSEEVAGRVSRRGLNPLAHQRRPRPRRRGGRIVEPLASCEGKLGAPRSGTSWRITREGDPPRRHIPAARRSPRLLPSRETGHAAALPPPRQAASFRSSARGSG